MLITFDLPHVFELDSDPAENALVLKVLEESLIAIDRIYLRRRGGIVPKILSSGVAYGRTRNWQSIAAAIRDGYSDCKSITAWAVAELRERKISAKPVFRFMRQPNSTDFHILVQTERGFLDYSKSLGMPQ